MHISIDQWRLKENPLQQNHCDTRQNDESDICANSSISNASEYCYQLNLQSTDTHICGREKKLEVESK